MKHEGQTLHHARVLFIQALGLHQKGNYEKAEALYLSVVDLDPCHLDAWNNLGAISLQTDQLDLAEKRLRRALNLNPTDGGTRHNFSRVMAKRALCYSDQDQAELAIEAYRECLLYDTEHHAVRINLENLLNVTGKKACLADYSNQIEPSDLKQIILIACMPKSGSTMLRRALELLSGYAEASATSSYLQNEQELDRAILLALAKTPHIVQQHVRAGDPNIFLMQAFNIEPVILVRNLFDVVVSLSDFYAQGATSNTFYKGDFEPLGSSERFDLIIDLVLPWYFQFYVSWVRALEQGRVRGVMIRYESLRADQCAVLLQLSDFYGLNKTNVEIEIVVAELEREKHNTRFNKGISGRGQEQLTVMQKSKIESYTRHFNNIDFSPIL